MKKTIILIIMWKYSEDYNCVDFAQDGVRGLEEAGIESYIIVGTTPKGREEGKKHNWIAIPFEPITGKLITTDMGYEAIKIKKSFLVK